MHLYLWGCNPRENSAGRSTALGQQTFSAFTKSKHKCNGRFISRKHIVGGVSEGRMNISKIKGCFSREFVNKCFGRNASLS